MTETPPLPMNGLLVNGGFEVLDGDKLAGWETYGGVAARVDGPVWSGDHAASFASATDSTKWLYETVPVSPGQWYAFTAHVYNDDPGVERALLRISWYASADGSGNATASTDSTESLEAPSGSYVQLATEAIQAPPDAQSAKARIVLRPRSDGQAAIYVDDAWFIQVAEPASSPQGPAASGIEPSLAGAPAARSSTSAPRNASSQAANGVSLSAVVPQPSPVIRRSSVRTLGVSQPPSAGNDDWWRWAIPFGAAGLIAGVGWGAWWRERRAARHD
jgi:hypothetical protein